MEVAKPAVGDTSWRGHTRRIGDRRSHPTVLEFDPVDAIEAVRDHAVVVSDRASAQMTAGGHPRFRMGGLTRPDYELQ